MAEAQFVSDPLVIRWQSKLLKKSKSTARVYGEFLFTYWSKALKPRGLTLSGWLEELQRESEAKDNTVRTRWGTDLEEFVTTYVSESTKKGYAFKSRRLFVTALRNFLGFHLGQRGYEPYKFDLETSEEAVARKKEREDTKPISVEEFKRLVLSVKNNSVRDKAILLTLANGLGPGEWLQFSPSKDPRSLPSLVLGRCSRIHAYAPGEPRARSRTHTDRERPTLRKLSV